MIDLSFHLKKLEKEEQIKPKVNTRLDRRELEWKTEKQ